MPVEDVNFTKMGVETLNIVNSTETTTYFWLQNSDLISMFLVIAIMFGFFVLIFFLLKGILSKGLKR